MAHLSKCNLWMQWWSTSNKTSVQRPENDFPPASKSATTEEEWSMNYWTHYEWAVIIWVRTCFLAVLLTRDMTLDMTFNIWIVDLLCTIISYILHLKTGKHTDEKIWKICCIQVLNLRMKIIIISNHGHGETLFYCKVILQSSRQEFISCTSTEFNFQMWLWNKVTQHYSTHIYFVQNVTSS